MVKEDIMEIVMPGQMFVWRTETWIWKVVAGWHRMSKDESK